MCENIDNNHFFKFHGRENSFFFSIQTNRLGRVCRKTKKVIKHPTPLKGTKCIYVYVWSSIVNTQAGERKKPISTLASRSAVIGGWLNKLSPLSPSPTEDRFHFVWNFPPTTTTTTVVWTKESRDRHRRQEEEAIIFHLLQLIWRKRTCQ